MPQELCPTRSGEEGDSSASRSLRSDKGSSVQNKPRGHLEGLDAEVGAHA